MRVSMWANSILRLYSKLLISHLLGLLATVQHTRTRKSYGIRGDIGSDCVRATCCTCCTLIQDEKEIQKREGERLKASIASSAAFSAPYVTPGPMSYPPPPTREATRWIGGTRADIDIMTGGSFHVHGWVVYMDDRSWLLCYTYSFCLGFNVLFY